jgi:hypothetical protein
MKITRIARIDPVALSKIKRMLTIEPKDESDFNNNYMSEDETFTTTVKFNDSTEMDIKCCGVQYEENGFNTMWSEAVLFRNGAEIACSDPSDIYEGRWTLTDNEGNEFTAIIMPKKARDPENNRAETKLHRISIRLDNETHRLLQNTIKMTRKSADAIINDAVKNFCLSQT